MTKTNINDIFVVTKGLHYGKIVRISTLMEDGDCSMHSVDGDRLGALNIADLSQVGCVSPEMWSAEYICREGVRRTAEVVLEQKLVKQ